MPTAILKPTSRKKLPDCFVAKHNPFEKRGVSRAFLLIVFINWPGMEQDEAPVLTLGTGLERSGIEQERITYQQLEGLKIVLGLAFAATRQVFPSPFLISKNGQAVKVLRVYLSCQEVKHATIETDRHVHASTG